MAIIPREINFDAIRRWMTNPKNKQLVRCYNYAQCGNTMSHNTLSFYKNQFTGLLDTTKPLCPDCLRNTRPTIQCTFHGFTYHTSK